MIERLRPGGDSASLVYSAQKLVEMRFQTMKIESVQAATKLFEDVAMEIYHEVAEKGVFMACGCLVGLVCSSGAVVCTGYNGGVLRTTPGMSGHKGV